MIEFVPDANVALTANERKRYPVRTVLRFAHDEVLPGDVACGELAKAGVSTVVLAGALDLRDARALEPLRFVRDCTAVGIAVEWAVVDLGGIEPYMLMHLCPPQALPADPEWLTAWSDFAFGGLYWRRGPGFAIVRDVRPGWQPSLYTLEPDGTLEAFDRCCQPLAMDLLVGAERDGLKQLCDARLVLAIERTVLALPYRIRKWPVPFMAI